jgi:hypothetical protein
VSDYVNHVQGDPSGLTDDERQLLLLLAIGNLCRQTGCAPEVAAEALDHFTERGEVSIVGDQQDVYLQVKGHTHIHAARDWLRFHARAYARTGDLN